MKKQLLRGLTIMACTLAMHANAQVRFIDPVFQGVTKTSNLMYDSNAAVNILFGNPAAPGIPPLYSAKLRCDVYEPTGDTSSKRPLIILAHTGSYLPAVVNRQTTGNRNDSAIVELANSFAKRGYVVAAIDYRSGWNAASTVQADAREQLLKATFRGLQDARNAVRYLRVNASTYKIDTSRIILGGQGTGGYISLAGATVNSRADIESNLKFLRGNLSPMVSMDTLGDWTGLGGFAPLNYGADASVSSDFDMVFNYGGAMGDTAWMKPSSLPIVSLHCTKDPFAPYNTGNVVVPTTGITVIPNASGAGDVIPKANKMGINNKLNAIGYSDAISKRAMMVPNAENNMFGFESSFSLENAPWEWWSSPVMIATTAVPYQGSPLSAPFFGFLPTNGRLADSLSLLTNPNMSVAKGKAYCDTVVRYVAPRIAQQFDLTGPVTLNAFSLLSPANNAALDIYDSASLFFTATWGKSHVAMAKPGSTTYLFQLDTGNFKAPVFSFPLMDSTSVIAPQSAIYGLLTSLGVGAGQSVTLKWRVVASNPVYMLNSTTTNTVVLTKKMPVGIKEADLNLFVTVYPNPANDYVKVNMDNSKAPINTLAVYDIMGREVVNLNGVNAHNYTLNTNGFNPGVYIMNVKTSDGATATKRFTIN
jgi:acetyl esterase/lipase